MPARTPSETVEAAEVAGLSKNNRPFGRLVAGSVLAGAYIALGGTLSLVVGFGCPEISGANPGVQKLLSGLVFPIGLMLVVILGADLFTGNNALLIPPFLNRRLSTFDIMRNWAIVWLGNFAGALAFAYFLVYLPGIVSAPCYESSLASLAAAKTGASFGVVFLKGIGANWCVCLAVWLALSGRRLGEKLLACEIPVMAFVALGYEHCVANMFFLPLAMMQGAPVDITTLFTANLIPATLGNIVGGALFVGALQYYLHKKVNIS